MAEKVEGKKTEPEKEPEPTLTPEEQMEALETRVTEAEDRATKAETKATEKEEGFKTLQRRLSTKKTTPQVSTSGTAQTLQGMIDVLESQAEEAGGITPATQAKINNLRQQLVAAEKQGVYERQDAITNEWRNNFSAKIEAANLDPDDEKFDRFWTMVERAEDKLGVPGFEQAEKRLDHILGQAKPEDKKKAEPKEAELTPVQKTKAEREFMEKHGLLPKNDTGGAKGSSSIPTDATKFREWVEGLTPTQFAERKDEINEAYRKLK